MLYEKRGKVFKDEEKSAVRIHETAAASIPIRLQIRCLAKKRFPVFGGAGNCRKLLNLLGDRPLETVREAEIIAKFARIPC